MNDESMKQVERELGRFAAAALPGELRERLKEEPRDEALTMGDRMLVVFSGLGAMAAGIILTVVVMQMMAPSPPPPTASDVAAQQRLVAEYQELLAAR